LSGLEGLRRKIDQLDDRVLGMLNERAVLSREIGRLKRDGNESIYSPDREKQVIDRLSKKNIGPLSKEAVWAIYKEIMSYSKNQMKPLRIAYLGPEFTYTHEASQKMFGKAVEYIPCASINDVFTEIERERCDYGVVPVENSTEGAVTYTLDMFIQSDLKIFDEVRLRISHHLLSKASSLKTIKTIHSNPQAFAQCRIWLEANLPGAKHVWRASTADGAEHVRRSKGVSEACIASVIASKQYGLNAIAGSIEDIASNTTRFIVISRNEAKPTKKDRTSIVFELKDRVGALHDMLMPFRKSRINLTKIESRPSKKKAWSYYFFVDFDGHRQDPRVRKVLNNIEARCVFFKVLGSYPKAES